MAKYAAKTMDSVFSSCTDSELDFEAMFDEDDSLIDLVAGVNEAGELITGPDPEDTYVFQLDEDGNDPISDECDTARREGKVSSDGNGPKEGTVKDADEKFSSPEGMASQVQGSGNSAESHAHDLTQKIKDAIKGANEACKVNEVCSECGKPIKECGCAAKKKAIKESIIGKILADSLNEADDIDKDATKDIKDDMKDEPANSATDRMIVSKDDKVDPKTAAQVEGVDVSSRTDYTFEKLLAGKKEDPISDKEADDLRSGKEKYASSNVEAIKQKIIMAAQEQNEVEYIKSLIVANNEGLVDELKDSDSNETVPDSVQKNSAANNIPKDVETQSSEGLEPATEHIVYKGWLNNVTEAVDKDVDNMVLSDNDEDDDLINSVDNDTMGTGKLKLNVDYDDDELIDLAMSGKL